MNEFRDLRIIFTDACGGEKNCYKTLETDCPGPKCAQNVATRTPDPLCLGQLGEALAIGYDWLYDAMDEGDRLAVVHMITTQVPMIAACGSTFPRIHCNKLSKSIRCNKLFSRQYEVVVGEFWSNDASILFPIYGYMLVGEKLICML